VVLKIFCVKCVDLTLSEPNCVLQIILDLLALKLYLKFVQYLNSINGVVNFFLLKAHDVGRIHHKSLLLC
jgi:hypothetical protein